MTTPIPGWQDQGSIQQRAYDNWQTRINTPKGNPSAPQTFMNQRGPGNAGNVEQQYQMYYQQCVASGQQPMSPIQFMQLVQSGGDPFATLQSVTDPLVTVQGGIQAGKSLGETVMGIIGLFKGNKSSAPAQQTDAQKTLMNNYTAALGSGTEFKVDNLDDFVNAQFAGMKATGDIVTTEQFSEYLFGLGFDGNAEGEKENEALANVADRMSGSVDGKITKKELKEFYKFVMGNSKSISVEKLEKALVTVGTRENGKINVDLAEKRARLEAKGYTYITIEQNGKPVAAYQKDGVAILETDDETLNKILNE